MSEHEFKIFKHPFAEDGTLVIIQTGSPENFDVKTYNIREVVDLFNEQQSTINKEKELLELIANACSFSKEYSVKEILRNEIRGIDTVTHESANAWHDYVLLSEFFEEFYEEHWDNE